MAAQKAAVRGPGPERRLSRKMALFLHLFIVALMFSLIPSAEAIKWVSREKWGAKKPQPPNDMPGSGGEKGVKIHYTGDTMPELKHSECDNRVRKYQKQHMNDTKNDWPDLAYNLVVCQHGYVFEGRGAQYRSGANGNQTLNKNHYAVLGLVGNKGDVKPSKAMISGLRDAIAYLREKGAGNDIQGHQDGYFKDGKQATECPGKHLEKLVKNGSLDPSKSKGKGKDKGKNEGQGKKKTNCGKKK